MNNLSKKYVNDEGKEETLIADSSDNYEVKLAKKFKGSILGADIGVKSSGFSSVAILATVIALAAALVMYFIWRF